MIVVITGAPGAGKGTQADLLRDKLGFIKLSTGDALRKHVKQGTEIGKKAAAIMETGKLVPDDVLLEVLRCELSSDAEDKILLDGYPRNVNQAEALEGLSAIHKVAKVVHLEVPARELVRRLSGRRVCSNCGKSYHMDGMMPSKSDACDACGGGVVQRPDDQEDRVQVRLDIYDRETRPVLDYYREFGKYKKVDGSRSTEAVFADLEEILS